MIAISCMKVTCTFSENILFYLQKSSLQMHEQIVYDFTNKASFQAKYPKRKVIASISIIAIIFINVFMDAFSSIEVVCAWICALCSLETVLSSAAMPQAHAHNQRLQLVASARNQTI